MWMLKSSIQNKLDFTSISIKFKGLDNLLRRLVKFSSNAIKLHNSYEHERKTKNFSLDEFQLDFLQTNNKIKFCGCCCLLFNYISWFIWNLCVQFIIMRKYFFLGFVYLIFLCCQTNYFVRQLLFFCFRPEKKKKFPLWSY